MKNGAYCVTVCSSKCLCFWEINSEFSCPTAVFHKLILGDLQNSPFISIRLPTSLFLCLRKCLLVDCCYSVVCRVCHSCPRPTLKDRRHAFHSALHRPSEPLHRSLFCFHFCFENIIPLGFLKNSVHICGLKLTSFQSLSVTSRHPASSSRLLYFAVWWVQWVHVVLRSSFTTVLQHVSFHALTGRSQLFCLLRG